MGEAAQQFGAALGEAADTLDKLAAERDEAGAKGKDAQFIPAARKIESDFVALQGANASAEAMGEAQKRLHELQNGFLGMAETPRERAMLGEVLAARVGVLNARMQEHSVRQIGVAWEAASAARQTASAEAAIAATDPVERRTHIDTGISEMRALAARRGLGEDVVKTESFKFASGIHAAVALDMVDADNVDGALAYLEENRDEISGADETRINKALRDPLERRETIADTAGILRAETGTEAGASTSPFDPLDGAGRMPVNGGGYGAARDYGAHNAVDIPAARSTPIKPERVGTATVSRSAKGGNIVTIDYGDGTKDKFMHLDQVRVESGDRVTADTVVGTVGSTGRSSGPHLHWQRLQGGKAVNPLENRGGGAQQAPQRHDLASALAEVDRRADAGGWSAERRERAKGEVEKLVAQDEQLFRRREDEAERQAWDAIDRIPDNKLTSMSQIPSSVRSNLSPQARVRFEEEIARNLKPPKTEANGDAAITLKIMAGAYPEQFAQVDLRPFRSQLTPGEFEELAVDQAKLRTKPKDQPFTASLRSEIHTAIGFYGADINLGKDITNRTDEEGRRAYGRISDSMRGYLQRATDGGKRKPTDDEMKAAFDHATMEVIVRGGGTWGGDTRKRRFEVEGNARIGISIPGDAKTRIEQSFARARRRLPTPEETMQIYLANKGKPGFWR